MRRTLLTLLVSLVAFCVFVQVGGEALDKALEDTYRTTPTQQQVIARAEARCERVWVEHKVKPRLPDEVLASGCTR